MFCQCQSIARYSVICIYSYLINIVIEISDYKTCSLRIILVIVIRVILCLSVCKGMSLESVLRYKNIQVLTKNVVEFPFDVDSCQQVNKKFNIHFNTFSITQKSAAKMSSSLVLRIITTIKYSQKNYIKFSKE